MVLRLLSTLELTQLKYHPTTGDITECTNLTILNVFLVRLGPMNEKRLVKVLIGTQVRVVADSGKIFLTGYGNLGGW